MLSPRLPFAYHAHVAKHRQECPKCRKATFGNRRGECTYCGTKLPEIPAYEEPRMLANLGQLGGPAGDDRQHYLVPEYGDPVRIDPGRLFVLGRDAHADMVINSPAVSRKHAEIDWEGSPPRPLLCELRSSDGTFLNDRRVERRETIQSGDEIRLGGRFVLNYFFLSSRDLDNLFKDIRREATRRLTVQDLERERQAVAQRPAAPKTPAAPSTVEAEELAPWGAFSAVAPPELLEWYVEQRSSGVLTFFDGEETGEIYLQAGSWKFAFSRGRSGHEVVKAFLKTPAVAYRFCQGPAEPPTAATPIPRSGRLLDGSCRDLIDHIQATKSSGVLTVFDHATSGEATFVQGAYTTVQFSDLLGKFALPLILRLAEGSYRFRPMGAGTARHLRRPTRPGAPVRQAPPPRPTRPSRRRPPPPPTRR